MTPERGGGLVAGSGPSAADRGLSVRQFAIRNVGRIALLVGISVPFLIYQWADDSDEIVAERFEQVPVAAMTPFDLRRDGAVVNSARLEVVLANGRTARLVTSIAPFPAAGSTVLVQVLTQADGDEVVTLPKP